MANKPRQFIVKWEIDIYAENAKDAAKQALAIQRDAGSDATYFRVEDVKHNMSNIIDLEEN